MVALLLLQSKQSFCRLELAISAHGGGQGTHELPSYFCALTFPY